MLDVGPRGSLSSNTHALYWKEGSTRIKSANPKQDPPKECNTYLFQSAKQFIFYGFLAGLGGSLGAGLVPCSNCSAATSKHKRLVSDRVFKTHMYLSIYYMLIKDIQDF